MRIGDYECLKLLGRGGMSEVYEVVNRRLGTRHALKLFACDKHEPEVRERFRVEGRLLARLSHPRIVKVTDFGTDDVGGRPYFVMELVLNERGEPQLLSDVKPGTVDEDTVGKWYDDIREGLAYIHANGVIHRDLKLQNVLVGPDGHAVIADFGISKIFDANGDGAKVVDSVSTLIKMCDGRNLVMGSVGYMAPELEIGASASPKSDWYALGVIVYRLLTGVWCDSRTNIIDTISTYDPAWQRIIPSLLHSNPEARKCISYADTRRENREREGFELEERCADAESRARRARRLALVALAAVVAGVAAVCVSRGSTSANWQGSGGVQYEFDEVFSIPPEAKPKEPSVGADGRPIPSVDKLDAARIDLLVLTKDIFSGLRSGNVTVDRAIRELEEYREAFRGEKFNKWPREDYWRLGNDESTRFLLDRGVRTLQEKVGR